MLANIPSKVTVKSCHGDIFWVIRYVNTRDTGIILELATVKRYTLSTRSNELEQSN